MAYENPITVIAIVAGVFALLGYVIRLVLPRLLDKIDEKDLENKAQRESFTDLMNHKSTEQTMAINMLADKTEKKHGP